MLGEHRVKLLLQGLNLIIGVHARLTTERIHYFLQQLATLIERHNRILESRFFRIGHNRLNLLDMLFHALQ